MTTMRPRRGRASRGGRRGRLPFPFPVFLLAVCGTVTVGTTAVRAVAARGHAPQVLSGTAERLMAFLDYFAGVFTLLSLTAAVLCGLAATDRLVLTPRLRVAAQSVHRATSVAAVGFLVTHIAVKLAERDARPLAVLLPFGGGATFAVGLGTLAADLLVLAAATGAVRGRFADSRRPGLWRVLHASAYACWPIALAHGLTAGRAAAVWVLWSYGACGALVGLALLARALGAASALGSLGGRAAGGRSALRGYAARRPSRAALAELGRLSRDREPVPYAAHAYAARPAATPPAAGLAAPPPLAGTGTPPPPAYTTHFPAAAPAANITAPPLSAGIGTPPPPAYTTHFPAAAPAAGVGTAPPVEHAREHPRLADTPPHGIPVQGAQGHGLPGRRPTLAHGDAPPSSRPGAAPGRARHAASAREPWQAGAGAPWEASGRGGTPAGTRGRHGRGRAGSPAQPRLDWWSAEDSGDWGPLAWDEPAHGGVA